MSLREIERATGIPKSTIRETLKRKGQATRKFVRGDETAAGRPKGKQPGAAPYGYGWLEGQLVKDPREYETVLLILRLWQKGLRYTQIARHLNENGISTRSAKPWAHSVIRSVLKRERK